MASIYKFKKKGSRIDMKTDIKSLAINYKKIVK